MNVLPTKYKIVRSWLLGTMFDDKLKTASFNPNSVVFGIKPNVKLNVFV